MNKKSIYVVLISMVLSAMAGCSYVKERVSTGLGPQHQTSNYYLYPDFNMLDITKVTIAPFRNRTDTDNIETQVRDLFIQELKKTKRFEIVSYEKMEGNEEHFYIESPLSKQELIAIAKAAHIDGIILGEITQYHPYKPLILGVRLKMIQTITGEEVWALDELYDTSLEKVSNLAKEYYFRKMDSGHTEYKWNIVLESMQYFSQFVCSELANTFAKAR